MGKQLFKNQLDVDESPRVVSSGVVRSASPVENSKRTIRIKGEGNPGFDREPRKRRGNSKSVQHDEADEMKK